MPDLDGGAVKPPGTLRNAARQIQVKQEILAKRFAGPHIESGNELLERWQRVNGVVVEGLRFQGFATRLGCHVMPSGAPS